MKSTADTSAYYTSRGLSALELAWTLVNVKG